MGGGRADEADAGRAVGGIVAIEIVGGEEQEDAAARLIADEARLLGRGGAGEEDRGGVFRRAGGRMVTQRLSCSGWYVSSTSVKPSLPM